MSETATLTLPTWLSAEERRIAEQFPRDTADHQLEVLHDDGLYRHLKCSQPEHSWLHWFEVVTWPGSLAVRGDFGSGYVFSRTTDMFEFFRVPPTKAYRINPGYWSEKLPDRGRSVQVYSEAAFRARLDGALAEYEKEYPQRLSRHQREYAGRRWPEAPMAPDAARQLVTDYEEDDRLRFGEDARELLSELERADVLSETWEWSFTDHDWPFLWACHAIVWAIGQYDRAKAASNG